MKSIKRKKNWESFKRFVSNIDIQQHNMDNPISEIISNPHLKAIVRYRNYSSIVAV